jgi:hypothetical protein
VNENGSPLAVPPLDSEWRTPQDVLDPPTQTPVWLPNQVPSINHEIKQTLRRLRQGAENPDDVPLPPSLTPEGVPSLSPPLAPEGEADDDPTVVPDKDQATVPDPAPDPDLDEPVSFDDPVPIPNSLDDPVPFPNREPPDPGPSGGRPVQVRRPNSRIFGPEWAHTSERPPSYGSSDRRKVRVHGLNEQYLQSLNRYLAVTLYGLATSDNYGA